MSPMSPMVAAIGREEVATYVSALFTVFYILIFMRIVLSWVVSYRGSIPYNTPLRAVTGFVEETVDPYLNTFRRVLPPVGGRFALDLSPVIGIIALLIAQAIVVGLIRG
jgi:YggT family protein